MEKLKKILEYLENEAIPLTTFERKAKLGYSYLSKTRDRGAEITQKALDKILENAPDDFRKIFPDTHGTSVTSVVTQKGSVEQKYIALLERQVSDQERLQQLEIQVSGLQQTVEALFARVVGGLEVTMECFADLLKKPEKDLKRKILSRSHEQLREMASGGTHVDIGS